MAIKKYLPFFLTLFFFIGIFLFSLHDPTINLDLYFHIKSGQVILQHGITHTDYLSYVTAGREWYPYEWLFQVPVYLINQNFGMAGISYFIGICEIFFIAGIFFINKYVFKLSLWINLLIGLFIYIATYTIAVPRPGLLALACLVWNLFFILLYLVRKKNYLWISLPLTFIWTNIHGSMILDVYLFVAYTVICIFLFVKTRENIWRKRFLVLGVYSLATFLITVGPPLWTTQYRLLLLFQQNNKILTSFITEWMPLTPNLSFVWKNGTLVVNTNSNSWTLLMVSIALLLSLGLCTLAFIRLKSVEKVLLMLPLLALLPLPFLSVRHIFISLSLSGIIIAYICAIFIEKQKNIFSLLSTPGKLCVVAICSVCFGLAIFSSYSIITAPSPSLPKQAASFILKENLQGNMYNGIVEGGYLTYRLYPQKRVFAEGRLDLYFCCELPLLYQLRTLVSDHSNPSKGRQFFDNILQKYDISYAEVHYTEEVPGDTTDILNKEKQWKLVYWDDQYVIYIKDDGKNTSVIQQFAATTANPFGNQKYTPQEQPIALKEYERMAHVSDSAVSEVGIAKIALLQKKYTLAKQAADKALHIDPKNASAYLAIGEVYFYSQDYQNAISAYQKTIELDNSQIFAYVRLGALFTYLHQPDQARAILLEGENNISSQKDKEGFQALIQQVSN